MNVSRLKLLANGRLLTAVATLLGIEISDTDALDWIISTIQQSGAEVRMVLRVAIIIVYAWYHPEMIQPPKADKQQGDGPAITYHEEGQ